MKVLNKYIALVITAFLFTAPCQANEDDGALESYNRTMFKFNSVADHYVIKPAAKGYRAVTNDFIRERVRNFYANLKEPASVINHTLQGNVADSGTSLGRFLVNSTLGLLGTFDVAYCWGLAKNKTDFDKTLA